LFRGSGGLSLCFAGKLSCPVALAQGGRDHKLVPGSGAFGFHRDGGVIMFRLPGRREVRHQPPEGVSAGSSTWIEQTEVMLLNRTDRAAPMPGEAEVKYLDGDFRVVRPGTFVRCAVTGVSIPLEELRYWSVDLQEAYATPEAVLQRIGSRYGRK
jgi:hypothetical protein